MLMAPRAARDLRLHETAGAEKKSEKQATSTLNPEEARHGWRSRHRVTTRRTHPRTLTACLHKHASYATGGTGCSVGWAPCSTLQQCTRLPPCFLR